MAGYGSSTWNKPKEWNEAAFVQQAVSELTTVLGLRLVISELDEWEIPNPDVTVVDSRMVAELRRDWLARALACFPNDWHAVIKKRVIAHETFCLSLVSHLDQVRFAIRTPRWIRATRYAALLLVALTVAAVALAIGQPYGPAPTHAFIVIAEFAPLTAAVLGITSAVGRDRFRRLRAQIVSDAVRAELTATVTQGFGRPISEASTELAVLSELSLDLY